MAHGSLSWQDREYSAVGSRNATRAGVGFWRGTVDLGSRVAPALFPSEPGRPPRSIQLGTAVTPSLRQRLRLGNRWAALFIGLVERRYPDEQPADLDHFHTDQHTKTGDIDCAVRGRSYATRSEGTEALESQPPSDVASSRAGAHLPGLDQRN
jgi:hypothetical protein